MPGDGRARRGLPGAESIKPGLSEVISTSSLSAGAKPNQAIHVGSELDRSRAWLLSLGELAAALAPDDALRALVRNWAASLDRVLARARR